LGGDLAQCLSSPGGINAKGKQLPRHLLSCPGALECDLSQVGGMPALSIEPSFWVA